MAKQSQCWFRGIKPGQACDHHEFGPRYLWSHSPPKGVCGPFRSTFGYPHASSILVADHPAPCLNRPLRILTTSFGNRNAGQSRRKQGAPENLRAYWPPILQTNQNERSLHRNDASFLLEKAGYRLPGQPGHHHSEPPETRHQQSYGTIRIPRAVYERVIAGLTVR